MSLLSLYMRFFRIGAFTIGGGIVMLGVIEAEMRATGLFSDDEIADDIVMATAVPGPIATNLSFLAGKRIRGYTGALVAVLGTVTAPFFSILFLSGIVLHYMGTPLLTAFFLGAAAGVLLVVGQSLFKMIKTNVMTGWQEAAAFIATASLIVFGVHPFIGLCAGALLSIGLRKLRP
ncbi:MAG: chromate transporter [Synergistaceae bacterium]|nr:chromate transporter [Synergistaceae bacterium]